MTAPKKKKKSVKPKVKRHVKHTEVKEFLDGIREELGVNKKTENPTKDVALVVRKLQEAFSMGCSITQACLYADITRDTYYRWIKEGVIPKEVSDKFEELKERPNLKALMTLNKDLDSVDTAKWWSERRMKALFSARQELSGPDGKELGVIHYPEEKKID